MQVVGKEKSNRTFVTLCGTQTKSYAVDEVVKATDLKGRVDLG
jgi:hypothetical protein